MECGNVLLYTAVLTKDMAPSHKKTVFILISRSFLTRNILRSGTLDELKKRGCRIIVFFQAKEIPNRLKEEFEDGQVTLHSFTTVPHWLHRRVNKLKRYFLDTHISNLIIRFETREHFTLASGLVTSPRLNRFGIAARFVLLKTLSHLPFLRALFRFIECRVFTQRVPIVEEFFNRYMPDVVLSTSLISGFDVLFLKEAHRRGVPTISMPKGWDNVTKEYYPFIPNWFAAPNAISFECATKLQDMRPDRVRIVGLPQFDWYARPDIRRSREDHLRAKGLDPARKVIFFGSEGAWSENDWRVAELLYDWIQEGVFGSAQLFIRPHYSDVQSPKFKNLRGKPLVHVDDYPKVEFLVDKWDPTIEETIDFTNSILHADVVINIASSLSLDAACADRPVVLVGFGCEFEGEKDVTIPKLYGSDHIRWLESSGGTDRADSQEQLKNMVQQALENPAHNAEGREVLRTGLCYRVDGKSSERLADLVEEVIASKV